MTLPEQAGDVYYRDLIGNISTSHFRRNFGSGESILELTPRFPMFGGWRNHFTIGYNLPSAEVRFFWGFLKPYIIFNSKYKYLIII
jgi:oligosaccharyltransferase complex subunit alpha (ribophorin I)